MPSSISFEKFFSKNQVPIKMNSSTYKKSRPLHQRNSSKGNGRGFTSPSSLYYKQKYANQGDNLEIIPKPRTFSPTRKKTRGKKKHSPKKPKNPPACAITNDHDIPTDDDIISRERCVALDCEMVGIGPGGINSALARVSVVNWNQEILIDTFVKVNEPVTDYRTFVSGVRATDIESDDAISVESCRILVENILRDKILIGHGLKNDLQALNLTHPWYDVRDTAKYEPYMKQRVNNKQEQKSKDVVVLKARKLKDLALQKLGTTIQAEGQEHSPVEDAIAALELYKLARRKWEKVMRYKMKKTREIELRRQATNTTTILVTRQQQEQDDDEHIMDSAGVIVEQGSYTITTQ